MNDTVTVDANALDAIVYDRAAQSAKQQIMAKMKSNAMFSSISSAGMFVAGPLFSIGASLLIPALKAAAGTAAAAMLPVGISLMAVAAVALGAAVVSGYIASMSYSSGQFDNFEMNAQSTARHLIHDLKTEHTGPAEEHTQNVRADGKKWTQVVGRGDQGELQPT